jgi:acetyltransferase
MHVMDEARFSVLLTDDAQGLGLGTELLRRLIRITREEGLKRLESTMTEDNKMMQHICKQLGFEIKPSKDEGMVVAQLELN